MNDSFKGMRNRNKVATMPIPGEIWDGLPPIAQLAMLVIESAKFMAAMHEQEFGGFRIVVMRGGGEAELVLIVGRDEPKSSIVTPDATKLVGFN